MPTTSDLVVFFVISIPLPKEEFGNGGKSDFFSRSEAKFTNWCLYSKTNRKG